MTDTELLTETTRYLDEAQAVANGARTVMLEGMLRCHRSMVIMDIAEFMARTHPEVADLIVRTFEPQTVRSGGVG
jgi:hypothetical protein